MMIKCKTPEEIDQMRESCNIASATLSMIRSDVKVGVSTEALNKRCHEFITDHGAIPSPLNYHGFPKSICTSINKVVCHGIPSKKETLKAGDIINIDITAYKNGYHGDTSFTFVLDGASQKARDLVDTTYQSMWEGINIVRPGIRLGDIGHAIQTYAENRDYSVVREFSGHGIGREFHEAPMVAHYGHRGRGDILPVGTVFTIEPMINIGQWKTRTLADEWTAVTVDGQLSAQFEHTLAVTASGFEVLTRYDWLKEGQRPTS